MSYRHLPNKSNVSDKYRVQPFANTLPLWGEGVFESQG